MVYKQKESKYWWFKFVWQGDLVRESTKQTNKRTAEQMEAARRTQLAKGEVGIRDRPPVPTLKGFAETDFGPFIEARFVDKPKTLEYYRNGLKNLRSFDPLANAPLDTITAEKIAGFVETKRGTGLEVTSINRQLEVLRRMLKLAAEWNKVDKALPRVQMLPGERHRERVLGADEEERYLQAASALGNSIQAAYTRALEGLRAQRGQHPAQPENPYLLRDVATLLIDCALRPEECFRLRWEDIRDGAAHVLFGKTDNARRIIPLTPRALAVLDMLRTKAHSEWVFPAPTKSGHIEKSSLKKQHAKAIKAAELAAFELYTFRHTCLTRWAEFMDPYTLAYLAGHSDFATTKRYIHPQAETVRAAMERAREGRGGHRFGHRGEKMALTQGAEKAEIQ